MAHLYAEYLGYRGTPNSVDKVAVYEIFTLRRKFSLRKGD
jgi:hypothetical protein